MEPRLLDESNNGFFEWKIKSLQFWGENPSGEWTVIVKDEVIMVQDYYVVLTNNIIIPVQNKIVKC